MNIQRPDPAVPLVRFDSVLGTTQHQHLLELVDDTLWQLEQPYPCRIFTKPEHSEYLQQRLQDLIGRAAAHARLSGQIQQIFLGWELPGCRFMHHRAHANIGAVIMYNLDDFGGVNLEILTQSHDHLDDYLVGGPAGLPGLQQEFAADSALMVVNAPVRHHWGFTADIGPGRVKRTIWIYLGK